MSRVRSCQVSIWDIDAESLSQIRNAEKNNKRRRRFLSEIFDEPCCCILQILIGIILSLLFVLAIFLPLILIPKDKKENNNTSISTVTTTTMSTTTTTWVSTTTSTSVTTSTTSETTSTVSETTATTPETTTTSCYFGDDHVNLIDGGQRRITNLKVGDRVWSLSNDGKHFIEDEVFCIPHAGPNTPTFFYTFTTIEGHTISLTDSHFIVVFDNNENKMKIIPASQVTLKHELIMANHRIAIEKITYSVRIGFYSPITLSGYLLVNNISTLVYSDILQAPHDFLHQIAAAGRIYYHLTRWLFGNNYIPFETSKEEAKMHPISQFIIDNYEYIRLSFIFFPSSLPILSIFLIIYLIHRIFFNEISFYLKLKRCIDKLTVSLMI